ncbi:class I SAM-dependent DNA methyltransferase [Methanobrevibacter sp.]|uniref:class I SAM-dependent DNA methyltransferase n=1 Tax=Methanobrevibacter sp. TaxID=66852 RepID=UPI003869A41F
MALTQKEMRQRASKFIDDYKDVSDEKSYYQMFWRDFFDIFGINWKDVAVFELAVKKFGGSQGFIDCFWKGKLIVEHKSRGKSLTAAFDQAIGYLDTLSAAEKPRYVIVSDFERIRVYDLFTRKHNEIKLIQLEDNIKLFSFIYEDQVQHHEEQEELNIEAAELMGQLHDYLKNDGYTGKDLELFLIRLLFIVYAEDTGIFEENQFKNYISNEDDPSTVGLKIQMLFRVLNQPEDERQQSLPEELKSFPYVNGKLFETQIIPPNFDNKMYYALKDICRFNWSGITPSIFGSMFQAIMNPKTRRNLGAHYTSEANILKIVNSLFMNKLWEEFYEAKGSQWKLEALQDKISKLEFLDPASGSANFLIISYRELRLLEYEILSLLLDEDKKQVRFEARRLSKIKLGNFHGFEIEELPSLVSKVSMYLVEHQMDLMYESLDIHKNNLPLPKSADIHNVNALRIDWKDIVEPSDNLYILGNPPFVGSSLQTDEQKADMATVFSDFKSYKNLDYVTAWYKKALDFMQGTTIECAFVSTNSICQGQQVPLLWKQLHEKYDFHINFAHQSFKWSNEAKNNAGVYVVIVGFSAIERENKTIYVYETPTSIPYSLKAKNINSYLVDFENVIIEQKSNPPICDVPIMVKGSQPTDDGNLLLSVEEKNELLIKEPNAEKWIRPLASAKEFLNGKERYCLWLKDISPSELSCLPEVCKRVENVREFRLKSKSKGTRDYAEFPTLFTQDKQPNNDYIVVPLTTSEKREYVPICFFDKNIIVNNSVGVIDCDDKYIFGIITSKMHMTWMRYVAGRLESRYRYANTIVYNTYPFPKNVSEQQKESVIKKAQEILNVRDNYPNESLANLYDSLLMPPQLKKAHQSLDKVVDKIYRSKKFKDDNDRMKFLFQLYLEYTSD